MHSTQTFTQYEQLPEIYQKEADDFIDFLYTKVFKQNILINSGKRKAYGSLKGQIKMADDFDEPLEEFKEYM